MKPESFSSLVEQKLGKFPHFLIYAILEWLMIILLFVDGFLAFFSHEFAKFFELRIPCLLCTRIDHVLVHKHSSFYYNDSICEAHKKDVSSLAYCQVHKKLSDIRNMCEGCLLAFTTEKDSNSDKYKSLVGVLHKDIDCFQEDDRKVLMKPLKKDGLEFSDEISDVQRCSCCGEPLKFRSSAKYKRTLSMNAPATSPRTPLSSSKNEEGRNLELPHIKYTELKFASDNDSEIPEEEVATLGGTEDVKAATVPLLPDPEDINEDATRTLLFARPNRFFGIPLSDSTQASPRWRNRGNRKLSVDKLDFVLDPNDITASSEVDGDIFNRMKRQVRLDRKSLMALYMELDEERSASAIAVNNAMAMITRLQAEKAAVQMEALQYQRMMEEQAEYDQEALQVMKDMLLKRDEDVKDLEAELETYRDKYGLIKKVGSEICEVDADDDYQDIKSQCVSTFSEKSECGSLNGEDHNDNNRPYERSTEYGGGSSGQSSLDFDKERSFLLGLLSDLEKKTRSPSSEGHDSSDFSSSSTTKNDDKMKGNENKATLTREVSLFRERLRAIEADSGFLKHAAMTMQRGGDGTKLLMEIAQNLRKLRQSVESNTEEKDA